MISNQIELTNRGQASALEINEIMNEIAYVAPLKGTIQKINSNRDYWRGALDNITFEGLRDKAARKGLEVTPEIYEIVTQIVDVFTKPGQADHCLKCIEIYEAYGEG